MSGGGGHRSAFPSNPVITDRQVMFSVRLSFSLMKFRLECLNLVRRHKRPAANFHWIQSSVLDEFVELRPPDAERKAEVFHTPVQSG